LGTPFTAVSKDNEGLGFDGEGNFFHFEWKTKGLAAGTYEILLALNDCTLQTKVVQLVATGGNGNMTASGSSTSGSATANGGVLLAGEATLAISDPAGLFTADELARIRDAIAAVDATVAPYGVTITVIDAAGS